ncbi:MAG TPA: TonB-dependent receptor [Thermoanaerobaculia bacterium]|nr:TonB-dependent receptor [Thermoanaerobaculia bacterium]
MLKRLIVCLTICMVQAVALAQSMPTSTLTGRVAFDGAPVPGVKVTVSSVQLQGTRTAVTTPAGDYILPFLPPGDYSVKFELAGMQTAERKVNLTATRTEKVNVELKPASVTQVVTVTAETVMTAPIETTQVSTNFKQDLIENLPMARTIQSVVLLAPGVNANGPGGNISISGAMSFDSLYLVNGAIVNENLRGQAQSVYIEDAIQETTTLTAGISAEYGHFTGGVVNMITKSGGNQLKGSFRTSLTNESWSAKTAYTVDQEDKVNPVYEATLGGPFWKDKLWFFGAGRYAETGVLRQTLPGNARTGDQDANGTPLVVGSQIPPITYPNDSEELRLEGKLTFALTPKHSFVASYVDVGATENNQTGQAIMDLDSLVKERETPNTLLAVNYSGVLTSSLFAEAQYSRKEFSFLGGGSPYIDDPRQGGFKGTLIQDRARGTRYWSPTFRADPRGEQRNHDLYTLKGTYFLSTPKLGNHEIKAGYEHFLEVRDVNSYQNGSDYRISATSTIIRGNQIFPRLPGGSTGTSTYINWLPIFTTSEGSEYASDSVFVNDRWTLDRWSFNLGLRYDKNDARSGGGDLQIADDSAFSPRLGVQYDVLGSGKLLLTASYGQYVGRLSEGIGNDADPAGRSASFSWYYRGPSINSDVNAATSTLVPTEEALRRVFEWFFANGGVDRRPFRTNPSVPGVESTLDPNGLKSPNVKEWTFGVGAPLGGRGLVRADFIYRNWDDFYVSRVNLGTGKVTDAYGTTYDHAIVGNDSSIYDREYTGIQTQFSYRFTPRFNLGGTYTWSRLVGNVTGEDSGTGPLTGIATERPEYRQESWNYPTGYLNSDQRHRAKVWLTYDLPTPIGLFNFSLLESFDSGTRTSVDGAINSHPYVTNPGYQTYPTGISYFFGGRGNLSTDDITRTDLAVNYKLPVLGVDLFLQAEIINLFNEKGVVAYDEEVLTNRDETYLAAFNPFTETPIECPQGAAAAECQAMKANWQKGQNFGLPNSEGDYQTPRAFRFSVGLRF